MDEARELHLRSDVTAARQARAFVTAQLGPVLSEDVLDDALLIVSELVSNAVMHSGTESDLEVLVGSDTVELRLSDGDRRRPAPRRLLGGLAAQGRGLLLVGALSEHWGVDERADGKTVWARLRRTPVT